MPITVPIYIPTYNRAHTIATPMWLENEQCGDYVVVVHNEEQRELYLAGGRVPHEKIVVSGAPTGVNGLAHQRQWIVDTYGRDGEWLWFMDDLIYGWYAVAEPYYHQDFLDTRGQAVDWSAVYDTRAPLSRMWEIVADMMAKAGQAGAYLCGFTQLTNPFWKPKHWMTAGYLVGKSTLVRVDRRQGMPRWDLHPDAAMEDWAQVAEHLLVYGRVLINRFVRPDALYCQTGGMGSWLSRIPMRERQCRYLMDKYPGLFRTYLQKPEGPDGLRGHDLALRLHTPEQIRAWRKAILGAK